MRKILSYFALPLLLLLSNSSGNAEPQSPESGTPNAPTLVPGPDVIVGDLSSLQQFGSSGTQVTRTRIYARCVSIRASDAKMIAARSGRAAKAASVVLQSKELMRHPGLANLFKAIVVSRSAAHAIKILRYDRMVGIWHHKKIQFRVAVIANVRSHRQANLGSATAELLQRGQISHDDIRSRHKSRGILSSASGRLRFCISRAVAQEQEERECEIT